MPIYEYYCEPCNGVYEVLRPIREASEAVPCPVCYRDGQRMMPTTFSAFTLRDGYPRRIPDQGTYWHLGQKVSQLSQGGVHPNQHPEIDKPEPKPKLTKGEKSERKDRRRAEGKEEERRAKDTPSPAPGKPARGF